MLPDFEKMMLHRPRQARWSMLLAMVLFVAGALTIVSTTSVSAPGKSGPAEARLENTERGNRLVVLAMGDLRGEIQPCGCSPEGQLGGLPRRLSYLEQNLSGGDPSPVLVDLGNNFPPPSPQGELKIDLIQNLLKRFPPAAVLPGPNELALGAARLDPGIPYLISNDTVGSRFARVRTVRRGGEKWGIFGYLSPNAVYQKSQQRFRLVPVSRKLLGEWREVARREGIRRVILLFRGDDRELGDLHRSGFFDLIVAGNPNDDELNQVVERLVGGSRIPQVPTKGQGVTRLTLGRNGPGAVDWLSGKYPDHRLAAAPFKNYEERVKKLFMAGMAMMEKRRGTTPFAGGPACVACHAVEAAIWKASRHAGALKTLEKVGKQFDPECLACHVVGLNRGGFLSAQKTPDLGGVQCENCHGPGKLHVANPAAKPAALHPPGVKNGAAKPGEATCRTCHVGSHSPSFNFPAYWPKVKH